MQSNTLQTLDNLLRQWESEGITVINLCLPHFHPAVVLWQHKTTLSILKFSLSVLEQEE